MRGFGSHGWLRYIRCARAAGLSKAAPLHVSSSTDLAFFLPTPRIRLQKNDSPPLMLAADYLPPAARVLVYT